MQKIFNITGVLLTIAFFVAACTKPVSYNDIVSSDRTPPGPISNVQVQNEAGKATITYTLPASENILYVEATYEIRPGVKRQSVSSYYSNQVVVDGFAADADYKVELVTVSRANVRSEAVSTTVHPTKPPYLRVKENMMIRSTFGGVNVVLNNTDRSNVGVAILKYDSSYRVMKTITQHFGRDSILSTTVRGYDSLNYYWAFVTMDQFGNHSDTLYQWVKPIFEIQLPKYPIMLSYALTTDANPAWPVVNLINNTYANNNDAVNCWRGTGAPAFPVSCTIDLGGLRTLSRYLLYTRNGASNQFAWTNQNPMEWTLWGCRDIIPEDVPLPLGAEKGEITGNWVCLGRFTHPPKPSGQATGVTAADIALLNAGFPFDFDLDIPDVRYIRFSCEQNFDGTLGECLFNELTFFGQIAN